MPAPDAAVTTAAVLLNKLSKLCKARLHALTFLLCGYRKHDRKAIKTQSIFHPGAIKHIRPSQKQASLSEKGLGVRGGVQKKSSVLDRAALLQKRKRMDAGLQLALSGRT